jgi:hypothetical protein
VGLSGDLNARPENVNVEELLESIRAEWAILGPLIDVGPGTTAGVENRGRLTVGSRRIERDRRSVA